MIGKSERASASERPLGVQGGSDTNLKQPGKNLFSFVFWLTLASSPCCAETKLTTTTLYPCLCRKWLLKLFLLLVSYVAVAVAGLAARAYFCITLRIVIDVS